VPASSAIPVLEPGKVREADFKEMLVRFVLGALVSIVAGIISKTVGARFGGLFLAFPAILPASLTFVQEKEGNREADRDAVGAVLGGIALIGFAVVGETLFTRHNPALVLVLALIAWLVAIAVLYSTLALLRPDDCDPAQD
jgi:uncharacterized membrane protein (GlpM family)